MKRYILIVLLPLYVSAVSTEFTLKPIERPKTRLDAIPKAHFGDLTTIPQDLDYYAKQVEPMDEETQMRYAKEYVQKYFKPWHMHKLDIDPKDYGWEVRFVRKKPIFTEEGQTIAPQIYERWIANANYKALDTKKYKAITVRHTDVKALPIENAFYRDPRQVGEGFPFDYNQNSTLHINTPLYISHFSLDGRWAFVRASHSFGWVRVSDLALVSDRFIKRFENGNYAITIKDNLALFDQNGTFHSLVKLGSLFPLSRKEGHYFFALRDENAQAKLAAVKASSGLIAKQPIPFTPENVAKVAKEFVGEPYGWGGNYFCRDCSATTRDFFAPFGIFLRRNSSKQANDGAVIEMKRWPKAYKKRFITQNAKPFRSLLWVPGHIVLYIGEHKGEPVILHTYWGIRKIDRSKLITARTIISTTEPGKERSDVLERAKLIWTLRRIINF